MEDECRGTRRADVRLPGKGNFNSHGARPVHLIITMMNWIQAGRLSTKYCVSSKRPCHPRCNHESRELRCGVEGSELSHLEVGLLLSALVYKSGHSGPFASKHGTHKTVTAIFWP